jgi:ribosomal RNA-processing protein 8
MFAVKGWNLTAPLAKQVEPAKPKDGPPGKKSLARKRKREEKKQNEIDAENLGEYWEKVVEGGEEGKKLGEQPAEDPSRHASGVNSQQLGKKRKRKSEGKGDADKVEEKAEKKVEEEKEVIAATDGPAKSEDTSATAPLSKRQKKKQRREQAQQTPDTQQTPDEKPKDSKSSTKAVIPQPPAPLIPEPPNLTPLQKQMRAKLVSARFRHLNESLYTKPSADSLSIFKDNPDMFEDYHRGFAQQVEVWPENPVDGYVDAILSRGKSRAKLDPWKDKHHQKKDKKKNKGGNAEADSTDALIGTSTILTPQKPLPRNMRGQATIADLGCGTASLSYRLQSQLKKLDLTVHSFDLSKPTGPTHDLVTVADISALPLADGSVDVAIFCLALMGTNWLDFIDEAWRVLRWRGELWVSEIKSRFGRVSGKKGGKAVPINSIGSLNKKDKKKNKGKKSADEDVKEGPQDSADEAELASHVDGVETRGEGTDVSAFVAVLKSRGFVLDAPVERQGDAIDMGNKMFVKMQFVKSASPTKGKNVGKEGGERKGGAKGDVNGYGKAAMRMGITGRKFAVVAKGEEEGGMDEGRVLKPCLYKIR